MSNLLTLVFSRYYLNTDTLFYGSNLYFLGYSLGDTKIKA